LLHQRKTSLANTEKVRQRMENPGSPAALAD
jgi:hypothetical protein